MPLNKFKSDALFFAAHPDDGEILAGGLMVKLAAAGKKVVLADGTRGEMGTRGTPEIRAAEAEEAAKIMGIQRTNLELPDGGIGRDIDASIKRIVECIREYRPRLVFTHTPGDHHPDHNAISQAVKQAFFLSNVLKYDTGQERFGPQRLLYFWSNRTHLPKKVDFIVDITGEWEKKIEALKAHRSQVAGGQEEGPKTYLTSDLFWHRIESRFGYFGSLINVKYGEPYMSEAPLRIDNPLMFSDLEVE